MTPWATARLSRASWRWPVVPPLHDTVDRLTRTPTEAAGVDGRVGLYVCGITPYDATHLGHASTYLASTRLGRALARRRASRSTTRRTSTDVDDPLLERATATGVDWRELAASQTDLFRSDMAAPPAVIPPDALRRRHRGRRADSPRPCARLVDAGFALPGRHARRLRCRRRRLLRRRRPPRRDTAWHLGLESRSTPARWLAFFAERGGDPDRPGKREPLDPLLWRAARAGEPSWPSPPSARAAPAGTSSAR